MKKQSNGSRQSDDTQPEPPICQSKGVNTFIKDSTPAQHLTHPLTDTDSLDHWSTLHSVLEYDGYKANLSRADRFSLSASVLAIQLAPDWEKKVFTSRAKE